MFAMRSRCLDFEIEKIGAQGKALQNESLRAGSGEGKIKCSGFCC